MGRPAPPISAERLVLGEAEARDTSPEVHAWLGGYLHLRHDRDFVMILIGDHQPPAMVSGEDASWNVPVHVVASRRAVIDALVQRGFKPGLTPQQPSLGKMNELLPKLLAAFSSATGS